MQKVIFAFTLLTAKNNLGQRYLTISHSLGLEAVASHHPDLKMTI
jgi:hypothetical protein